MPKYNPTDKVKKYIVLGRKLTVKNLNPDGEDKSKVITEVYRLKPHSRMSDGSFKEYERGYYRELKGGRGTDLNFEEGKSYVSFDGTFQDFVDINFTSDANETHDIVVVKTYANKSFMKREK